MKRSKKSKTQFRQGDVLIERITTEVPAEAIPSKPDGRGRHVLADGEVTGHAHAVNALNAAMYLFGAVKYLEILSDTEVKHEEHAPIGLERGLYRVTRQREYSPEAIRNVQD